MLKVLSKIVALSVICILTGCGTTTGNTKLAKLNNSDMSQMLVKGKTTTQQVIAQLGEPSDVDFDERGNKKWTYAFTKKQLTGVSYIPYVNLISSGTNDTTKKLVMIFDKNDRLIDHIGSESKGQTKLGLVK